MSKTPKVRVIADPDSPDEDVIEVKVDGHWRPAYRISRHPDSAWLDSTKYYQAEIITSAGIYYFGEALTHAIGARAEGALLPLG